VLSQGRALQETSIPGTGTARGRRAPRLLEAIAPTLQKQVLLLLQRHHCQRCTEEGLQCAREVGVRAPCLPKACLAAGLVVSRHQQLCGRLKRSCWSRTAWAGGATPGRDSSRAHLETPCCSQRRFGGIRQAFRRRRGSEPPASPAAPTEGRKHG